MKTTSLKVKILALVLLWFGVVGVSSALTIPAPGEDRGNIGSLAQAGDTVTTATANATAPGGNTFTYLVDHWFSFTLDQALDLEIWTEFGSGDPMVLTFYADSDTGSPLTPVGGSPYSFVNNRVNPNPFHPDFVPYNTATLFLTETLAAGDYWLRVEASPYIYNEMAFSGAYTVRLTGTTVPIPPALLLFGSSLIGFITLGWRRSKA